MIVHRSAAKRLVPWGIMAVLMASVFTVSMGFGVVLPLLPYLIERLLSKRHDLLGYETGGVQAGFWPDSRTCVIGNRQ